MTAYAREETLLQVKDISLSYDSRPILSGINFDIVNITRPGLLQGQVVSLIGRSGIGKTQLFRILSGLQKPDSGSIMIRRTVDEARPKKTGYHWEQTSQDSYRPVHAGDMGVIFQNYYQFGWRTVWQSLQLAARQNRLLVGKEEEAILDHVAQFDLSDVLQAYPRQLSGGQQQRVSIIQQLLKGSDFLLLDEPFSGLDVCVLDKVVSLLLKVSLSHELKTLIIVSHDIETAVAISDTVFILGKKAGVEGSTIVKQIDLIERELAWEKDVREKRIFGETIKEIKSCL